MKKITLSFLWVVAVFMAAIPAYGAVTQQEALVKVKNLFSGQDADYFLMKDYKTGYWTFFVDPTPLQGWEHDCYVVDVSKTSSTLAPTKTKHRLHPSLLKNDS